MSSWSLTRSILLSEFKQVAARLRDNGMTMETRAEKWLDGNAKLSVLHERSPPR